eukprot:2126256-Rhodomonas_salina.1
MARGVVVCMCWCLGRHAETATDRDRDRQRQRQRQPSISAYVGAHCEIEHKQPNMQYESERKMY